MTDSVRFNKPYMSGRELYYISQVISDGRTSGNHRFTQQCHEYFQQQYDFAKVLLTTSCTDALEMSALLLEIEPGDEVIVPSFTFVSTANAFLLRGAKIVFADSNDDEPNINAGSLAELITPKTKAIVVVHYAGVACDMDPILALAQEHGLAVVEDAAQAIDSTYKGRPLGGLGDIGAFSFHETKNIISGEGGLLVLNRDAYAERAEILWEKGTNRSSFYRGEVDKYGWVDIGSSFLPSDMIAAFLFAQLENIAEIQSKRIRLWQNYFERLSDLQTHGKVRLPYIPNYAVNNGHMFYMVCNNADERSDLISFLKSKGIHAVFHYLPLHKSEYFADKHDGRILGNVDRYSDCLIRLPLFVELTELQQSMVIDAVHEFYG